MKKENGERINALTNLFFKKNISREDYIEELWNKKQITTQEEIKQLIENIRNKQSKTNNK